MPVRCLYTYTGNDPLDKTDPAGTSPGCAACNYTIPSASLSAVADALDYADVNYFTPLGPFGGIEEHIAEVPLVLALRGIAAESKGEGIVYERINAADKAEKPYIGRAKSEERFEERQQEHARDNPDAQYKFTEKERAAPGQPLREAEQRHITAKGGPTNKKNPNGGTSNKRNEIAPKKQSCSAPIGSRIPRC